MWSLFISFVFLHELAVALAQTASVAPLLPDHGGGERAESSDAM